MRRALLLFNFLNGNFYVESVKNIFSSKNVGNVRPRKGGTEKRRRKACHRGHYLIEGFLIKRGLLNREGDIIERGT